jgi:hypothetical protein
MRIFLTEVADVLASARLNTHRINRRLLPPSAQVPGVAAETTEVCL